MKALTLRCDCGRKAGFSVDPSPTHDNGARLMMAAIDKAGWVDLPGGGPGWMPGICPDCCEADTRGGE